MRKASGPASCSAHAWINLVLVKQLVVDAHGDRRVGRRVDELPTHDGVSYGGKGAERRRKRAESSRFAMGRTTSEKLRVWCSALGSDSRHRRARRRASAGSERAGNEQAALLPACPKGRAPPSWST
jgi:hypothetical protein